jgi:hypothetical protein
VIVTSTNPATLAAKKATTPIPIIMTVAVDPVGAGLVASLARPGANVTGLTFDVDADAACGKTPGDSQGADPFGVPGRHSVESRLTVLECRVSRERRTLRTSSAS